MKAVNVRIEYENQAQTNALISRRVSTGTSSQAAIHKRHARSKTIELLKNTTVRIQHKKSPSLQSKQLLSQTNQEEVVTEPSISTMKQSKLAKTSQFGTPQRGLSKADIIAVQRSQKRNQLLKPIKDTRWESSKRTDRNNSSMFMSSHMEASNYSHSKKFDSKITLQQNQPSMERQITCKSIQKRGVDYQVTKSIKIPDMRAQLSYSQFNQGKDLCETTNDSAITADFHSDPQTGTLPTAIYERQTNQDYWRKKKRLAHEDDKVISALGRDNYHPTCELNKILTQVLKEKQRTGKTKATMPSKNVYQSSRQTKHEQFRSRSSMDGWKQNPYKEPQQHFSVQQNQAQMFSPVSSKWHSHMKGLQSVSMNMSKGEPVRRFRKIPIPVTQTEDYGLTKSLDRPSRIKAVTVSKTQKRQSFLDTKASLAEQSKYSRKQTIHQNYLKKAAFQKAEEEHKHRDAPSLSFIDMKAVFEESQRKAQKLVKENKRQMVCEKMDASIQKIKKRTNTLVRHLSEKDFDLELSEGSSNHSAQEKYNIDMDNTIHNRIHGFDGLNYDKKGGPVKPCFQVQEKLSKLERRQRLAEGVMQAAENDTNKEFLLEQRKLQEYTASQAKGKTLFDEMGKYLDEDDKGDEARDQNSSTDSEQENKQVKKEGSLAIAIKRALIKNILDSLSKTIKDEGSDGYTKLQTAFKILSTQKDPYIEVYDSHFKKQMHIKDRAAQVVRLLQFTEIGRFMGSKSIIQAFSMEPMMVYHENMRRTDWNEVALPLINKVIQNKLILQDYTLDQGHCTALARAIKQTGKPEIHSVLLDNCGIDDEEIGLMLDGLTVLNCFQTFVYKNNVFLDGGLEALKPLLIRPSQNHLQEIRLVNLKTNFEVINNLLDFMIQNNVPVRCLGLVQLHLGCHSLEKIAQFVDQSVYLEVIDLSWNDCLPKHFVPLLGVLSRNLTIKSLNLSWNNLLEKSDMNNAFDVTNDSLLADYVNARSAAIKNGSGKIEEDNSWITDHPKFVMYCFCMMIRRSKNLQTLILSSCGLNSQVLVGLVRAIRHCKALVCLHLEYNPGMNADVLKFYKNRMRCKEQEVPLHIDVHPKSLKNAELKEKSKLDQINVWGQIHLEDQYHVEEVCQYINNQRLKPLVSRHDVKVTGEGLSVAFTRILGHKITLPGEAQWRYTKTKEKDQCWGCDNWNFTYIFWNKSITKINSQHQIKLDQESQTRAIQKIKMFNDTKTSEYADRPVLFSNASNWKPRPFFNMIDLLFKFDKANIPNIEDQLIEEARQKFNFYEMEDLGETDTYNVRAFILKKQKAHVQQWKRNRIKDGLQILKDKCGYKKPLMINEHLVRAGNYEEMWVLPIYLKAGKIDNFIRSAEDKVIMKKIGQVGRENIKLLPYQNQDDSEFLFFYERHFAEIRQENIPIYVKTLKVNQAQLKFDKEQSVWCEWREDSNKVLTQCMHDDMKFWKLQKITKEWKEQDEVRAIFKKHYHQLKELFDQISCNWRPPDISYEDLLQFLRQANVLDSKMHAGMIGVYFSATNYELTDLDQNDDKELCRFEFMEILIRIAKGKYIDFGSMTSLSQAFTRLLDEHILHMHDKMVPWQKFRDEHMWNLPVSDLLMVNLKKLGKLYKEIASLKEFRTWHNKMKPNFKIATIDQIQMFLHMQIPGISDKNIMRSFHLSKMTRIEPMTESIYADTFLKWPEFLEFVPRLAMYMFKGTPQDTEWVLVQKLKPCLDHLFALIDEIRVDPPDLTEVISESDDDY